MPPSAAQTPPKRSLLRSEAWSCTLMHHSQQTMHPTTLLSRWTRLHTWPCLVVLQCYTLLSSGHISLESGLKRPDTDNEQNCIGRLSVFFFFFVFSYDSHARIQTTCSDRLGVAYNITISIVPPRGLAFGVYTTFLYLSFGWLAVLQGV